MAAPELIPLKLTLCAGIVAALVGIVFGLPSLRIRGFYLAVATLAAQRAGGAVVAWQDGRNSPSGPDRHAPAGSRTIIPSPI